VRMKRESMKPMANPVAFLVAGLALLAGCSSGGNPSIGGGQTSVGGTTDFGIAYIKRQLPTDPTALAKLLALDDLRHQRPFLSKADVYIRDAATPAGKERNITAGITGTDFYDIRDLDVSADGTRLVFALRGPLDPKMKDYDPPLWRVYEYIIATNDLHPLTDDVTASGGQDVSPHFLASDSTHPFGRILLTSTRQRQSKGILLLEGKPGFEAQTEDNDESAFTLEVLDPTLTGPSAYQQISYNQSHDRDPTVLSGGRVLYSRWDHAPGGTNAMHLYTMNPDGSDVQLLYGAHSHAVGSNDPATGLPTDVEFVHPHELQDGRILALARPFDPGTELGGNLVIIDTANYAECTQRTIAAGAGPAATTPCPALAPATPNDVRTIPGPSPGGRFHSAFPLWDNTGRILVSWSLCRLQDTTGTILPCNDANLANAALVPATPLYSIFLFNPVDNTFKPVLPPEEHVMITDAVSLQARTQPLFVQPANTGGTMASDGLGIIDIRSIYDWGDATWPAITALATTPAAFITSMSATPASQRPARFLRIVKAVSLGDKDLNDGFPDFDRGVALQHSVGYMREILGYVPIEADGSVRVKVPANVAFQVSVLDKDGHRIPGFPQHRSWLQLRPGEVQTCTGCHAATTPTSTTSHGRAGLFASANIGDASGHTIAQQLYGTASDCALTPCNAPTASLNMSYDPLLDPQSGGAPAIDTNYQGGLSTVPPTPQSCLNSYLSSCRITINYGPSGTTAAAAAPANIHPLWNLARGPVSAQFPSGANSCLNCHVVTSTVVPCTLTTIDPVTGLPVATTTNVTVHTAPAAGLDLSDDAAQQVNTQLRAYTELMAQHTSPTYTFNAGTCSESQGAGTYPGSISAGSAANSRFFQVLSGAMSGTVNHAGFMTAAELRLMSEWVDIGAQYYNNPFNAPLN
jgi:hypothetical protein